MTRGRRRKSGSSKRANKRSSKDTKRSNELPSPVGLPSPNLIKRSPKPKPKPKNARRPSTRAPRPSVANATRSTLSTVGRKTILGALDVTSAIVQETGALAGMPAPLTEPRRCQPKPNSREAGRAAGGGRRKTRQERNRAFIPWCDRKVKR